MNNRKWIIIVGVIILAGAGIILWQSSSENSESIPETRSGEKSSQSSSFSIAEQIAGGFIPDIDVVALDISNIDKERVDGTSRIMLKNPLPIDLSTNNMKYAIYIDSIRVVRDAYNRPLKIGASDSAVVEVSMKILKEPMDKILSYFERYKIDSANYRIKLNVELDIPVAGEEDLSFEYSKELPAIRFPEIEMEDFDPNLFSEEGMGIVLQVTNPNIFGISISNGYFSFIVHDEIEMVGEVEDQVNLSAFESEKIKISTRKKWGSLTQTGLKFTF